MARQASKRNAAEKTVPDVPPADVSPADVHAGRGVRDHLGLLAEMTREFTASSDYKTVAHSALARISNYMGAEAASLFLVSDTGEALVCSACYGPVDITGLNISANTGVVGRAVAAREGALVRDVSENLDFGAAVDAKT